MKGGDFMSLFKNNDINKPTLNTWYELIGHEARFNSLINSFMYKELAVTTVRLDNLAKSNPGIHNNNRADNSLLFIIILFLLLAWWWQGGYGYGSYIGYPGYGGYGGYGFYDGY